MAQRTAEERFWAKVDTSGGPDACWPWLGSFRHHGYGQFSVNGKLVTVPRWILGKARGKPLRWDSELRELACHRCDNPPCCNPAHLYVGTHKANTGDMIARGRHGGKKRAEAVTHCPRGHEYNAENTHVDKNGGRSCRICSRWRQRRGLRSIRVYP